MMQKRLKRHATTQYAYFLAAGLIAAGLLHYFFVSLQLVWPESNLSPFVKWFDLDSEKNLPTAYSALLLAGCAVLAWRRAHTSESLMQCGFWVAVGASFAYGTLDEWLIIHEQLAAPIRSMFHVSSDSWFFHAWVVVGLIVMLGVACTAFVIKHRQDMHKEYSLLFTVLLYMAGVIFFELAGTRVYGNQPFYRLVMVPGEELFEIGMASYIIYRLLPVRAK